MEKFIVGFGFLGISTIWPIFLQAGNPEFERQLLEAGREIPAVVGFGLAPSLALFLMTWDNLINECASRSRWRGRNGRRRVIQAGLVGLTVFLLASYFLINGTVTLIAMLVVLGAFWALVNVNSLPLVYDYGDERRIGAYTGLYYFSSQSAAVLGPTLGGILVDLLSDQYRWLFAFSTVFMALAWLAMTRVGRAEPAVEAQVVA